MMPRRPAVRPAPTWRFPRPVSQQLSSGLTVDHYLLPGQRVVTLVLVVDAPLTAEPAELEGVSALTIQACDEGTETHPGTALTEALEGCGAAVVAAGAGLNGAYLSVEVPGSRLPEALPLMAELVREPVFAADDVARLVESRLLAIATAECSPPAVASKAFYSALGDHRLARPIGGDADTVARLSREHLHAWHEAAICPERSRLIMAGDLPGDAAQWADAAFGSWTPPAAPELPASVSPPAAPPRSVLLVDRPDAAQVSLRIGTLTPTRTHEDWAALQVANAVVGSMFGSRLNTVLREERGLTYGAGSSLGPGRDAGVFLAHVECRPDSAAEAVRLALELIDVGASPITEAEVRNGIAFITGSTPLRLDTADAIAVLATDFTLSRVPADWFDAYMLGVSSVTAEAATAAFTRYVRPDDLVVAICGDAASIEPELQKVFPDGLGITRQ